MIGRLAALALGVAAMTACSSRGPERCADPLSGVWTDKDGRELHITDSDDVIELHALHDSRRHPLEDATVSGIGRSATVIRLHRQGGSLVGVGQQFRALGRSICRVRWDVGVSECHASRMVVTSSAVGDVDPGDCSQGPAGSAEARLTLRLARALPVRRPSIVQ